MLALLSPATPAGAQATGDWNSARTLELVARARARRATPHADSGLANYRALATGYLYFYLDRKQSDERTLVKVDQLALEIYWAAPNRTKQRIIGLRDVSRLPNRMRYHLDHLTVVQDEFGDRIRMGDGDEVRDVPHPAAPGADSLYDYRLADSLSLQLPGSPQPVRVYQIDVRPRRFDLPAFIGAVFTDRATGDIVRMSFTFTPASYVDPRLDYIQVSLDNGLWEQRYWLPHEQRLEIRRQLPELDFVAGGVIRGVLRIGGYALNEDLPANLFEGYPLTAAPRSAREAYPFAAGIFQGLNDEGLAPPPELSVLRRHAAQLVGRRYLSGLPRVRFHLANASSALRYNRAEGVYLGGGASFARVLGRRLDLAAGYATAASHASLAGAIQLWGSGATQLRLSAERHALRELGIRPAAPGAFNTLTAATLGHDYLDPYFANAVRLELDYALAASWRAGLRIGLEEQQSATLATTGALFQDSAAFRPVRSIDEGRLLAGRLSLRRTSADSRTSAWSGALAVEAGTYQADRPEPDAYLRPTLELTLARRSADQRAALALRGAAGLLLGSPPAQQLFLLGGRGTLPGYPYRTFAGDRFLLAELEASRQVVGPWLRGRALAALGWSNFAQAAPPAGWAVRETGGARASLGLGVGLLYDILRLDLVRGLNGGEWQALLSVTPDLWDVL